MGLSLLLDSASAALGRNDMRVLGAALHRDTPCCNSGVGFECAIAICRGLCCGARPHGGEVNAFLVSFHQPGNARPGYLAQKLVDELPAVRASVPMP